MPTDDRQPLTTPRGFGERPRRWRRSTQVAGQVEKDYGWLNVPWGDVLRFRRGNVDLPGNGAPSPMGAIRTIGVGPFVERQTEGSRATPSSR